MKELFDILLNDMDYFYDSALKIRRNVHRYPELSGQEHKTMKYISDIFSALVIKHEVLPDNRGIVVEVGHGDRCIGLRCELDALPVTENTGLEFASLNEGVMHACGHDIHLATVAATMITLKKYEKSLDFTVKAFFQPSEEKSGGAEKMISLGCLENPYVDEVYGFHVDPTVPVGKIMVMEGVMNAAVTDFEIKITGRSCHGAHPDQGVDSIVVAGNVITALQSISSRMFSPTTPVVLTIGSVHGGNATNIICGEVIMRGTLRALSSAVMEELGKKLTETAVSISGSYGADCEVTLQPGYPELENEEGVTGRLIESCREVLGEDNVLKMKEPSLGADDFAYFTKARPGCYFNVGTLGENQTNQALHSEYFNPVEDCMKVAYKAFLAAMLK